jgi:hypothetical protein
MWTHISNTQIKEVCMIDSYSTLLPLITIQEYSWAYQLFPQRSNLKIDS